MGRPRLPDNVKALRGRRDKSPTAGPAPEFEQLTDTIPPPDTLGRHGARYWEETLPTLIAANVIQRSDLGAFEALCHLFHQFQDCVEHGDPVPAPIMAQFRAYCGEFGLTPASRTKVKSFGGQREINPFTANGKAKA